MKNTAITIPALRISLILIVALSIFKILAATYGSSEGAVPGICSQLILLIRTFIVLLLFLRQDELSMTLLPGFVWTDFSLLPLAILWEPAADTLSDLIFSQAICCLLAYGYHKRSKSGLGAGTLSFHG